MADEITQKHLDKARVRGAPSTIPGSTGLVGSYDCEEVRRQTVRALSVPLDGDFTLQQLRDAQNKLAQTAVLQKLRVVEQPLFALGNDPMDDVPHEWEWTLLLPVRGPAKRDEDAGISTTRIEGGMYLHTITQRGFADLGNLYAHFLGHFMPSRKQKLTRPLIYHRAVHAIEGDDPGGVTLEVFIPIQLSLERPMRLVDRESI